MPPVYEEQEEWLAWAHSSVGDSNHHRLVPLPKMSILLFLECDVEATLVRFKRDVALP